MRAGQLRHRVEIQERQVAGTALTGEATYAWATVANRWMDIAPTGGSERTRGDKIETVTTYAGQARYDGAFTTDRRIKWGTKYLAIERVFNIGGRDRMMELVLHETEE